MRSGSAETRIGVNLHKDLSRFGQTQSRVQALIQRAPKAIHVASRC